jgi:hypothetical protein
MGVDVILESAKLWLGTGKAGKRRITRDVRAGHPISAEPRGQEVTAFWLPQV